MPFDEDIAIRLANACAKHRVVFWQDEKSEFADTIGELSLPGVTVTVVSGDEFSWKRRILRPESPDDRFLVYRSGKAPAHEFDFLYDIRISALPFSCSQSSVWASECGLPVSAAPILERHAAFFGSKERRSAFAALRSSADWMQDAPGDDDIEFALLCAACRVKATIRLDAVRGVARCLLRETSKSSDEVARLLRRCGLEGALWRCLSSGYGYAQEKPSMEDFALEVLASACCDVTGKDPSLNGEADLLLDSFSRDRADAPLFSAFITRFSGYVEAECDFPSRDKDALTANFYLPGIDRYLIGDLIERVSKGTDCSAEAAATAARRIPSVSSEEIRAAYGAAEAAAGFESRFREFEASIDAVSSATECVDAYVSKWMLIDTDYRHFRRLLPEAPGFGVDKVSDLIEAHYGRFLSELARSWQAFVAANGSWPPAGIENLQRDFYRDNIFLGGSGRKAVIISDALRFECAVELGGRLTSTGNTAKASWALSTLPSYTQLGMAALLPNGDLSFDTSTLKASVDGQDATGAKNRAALLAAKGKGSVVVDAEDLLAGEPPEDFSSADLVYIYHNKIDAVGDKRDTEKEIFAAVEDAFTQIQKLIRLCSKAGYESVVITADHGFIYQNADPSTYEYASVDLLDEIEDAGSGKHSRRFIAAKTMPADDVLVELTAPQAGLSGDFTIGIPKGIRRLKLKGSGARFVHGGMTLQETLVPVVTVVPKGRKGAVRPEPVEVEVLTGGSRVINGPALSFALLQKEPVSATRLSQTVRVGVYDKDGEAVSPLVEMELASESSDPTARQTPVKLTISPDVPNGAKVTLRVEGRIGSTNRFMLRAEQGYTVRRNFGMDF